MKDHVNPTIIIDDNHTYFEKELAGTIVVVNVIINIVIINTLTTQRFFNNLIMIGEWEAVGINPNLLFGRYKSGGHFAPHTDGCTVIDFNYR